MFLRLFVFGSRKRLKQAGFFPVLGHDVVSSVEFHVFGHASLDREVKVPLQRFRASPGVSGFMLFLHPVLGGGEF